MSVVCKCVKTHLNIHLKWVHFIACNLYFDEVQFKKRKAKKKGGSFPLSFDLDRQYSGTFVSSFSPAEPQVFCSETVGVPQSPTSRGTLVNTFSPVGLLTVEQAKVARAESSEQAGKGWR